MIFKMWTTRMLLKMWTTKDLNNVNHESNLKNVNHENTPTEWEFFNFDIPSSHNSQDDQTSKTNFFNFNRNIGM